MDVGWNFRREHLRLAQRSHYVITNGGDQPNVVPPTASVWYYFREADYDHIMDMWRIGDNMAQAATLMTDTTYTSRLLGSAWPGHFNKAIAEAMNENIKKVGPAAVVGRRPDDGQGPAEGIEAAGPRPRQPPRRNAPAARRRLRPAAMAAKARSSDPPAAAPTISAMSPGTFPRSPCAIPRTSPAAPATTGRTASRWQRRSRTKA